MFHGIVQSRKTFLAQPEWRHVPWSAIPDSKAPFDLLVDILLDIPDLSAQRQALGSQRDPQELLYNASVSIREGQRIELAVHEWFDRFRSTVPGPLYHPELSKMDSFVNSSDSGKLFPVAFRFPAFVVGQNLIYYWVALMSVYAHLCLTYAILVDLLTILESMGRSNLTCTCNDDTGTGAGAGTEDQAAAALCLQHFTMKLLPALDHRQRWPRVIAYNICQSVEYFMQDELRGFGPASILPPLVLVRGFWTHAPGDWSREMAWVDNMLGYIHVSGSSIARVLS